MKAMKKVFAMLLALAMIVTAVPVADASAATYNMKAGSISKSLYAGRSHTLKLNGLTASKVKNTVWKTGKETVVKLTSTSKTTAKMKCVGKGYTVVTAKVTLKTKKTKTYKAKITVKNPSLTVAPVTSKEQPLEVHLGRSEYIQVSNVLPENGKVTYVSRDEGIAKVSGGKITGVSLGTTEIVTSVVCGTTKKSVVTWVKVVPKDDGLTLLGIDNPIIPDNEEYKDTVWVNDQACIRVEVISGGQPLAGENLVITRRDTTSYGADDATLSFTVGGTNHAATAVTNADGIATFVVGYNKDTIKVTDTKYVGHFDYTISLASDINKKVDGTVDFAAIGLGKIEVDDPSDYLKKTVSTNDYKKGGWWYQAGNGKTDTKAASTMTTSGFKTGMSVQYVDSHQVSTSDTDHKVTFKSFLPTIMVPNRGQKPISNAEKFEEVINKSYGPYYTYDSNEQTVAEISNPNELTYATLNFNKIQLSKYTKMTIKAYFIRNGWQEVALKEETINGSVNMLNHGFQIPLDENYEGKVQVKVKIESMGQVDAGMNAGYEVSSITGVYKTKAGGWYSWKELPGATVEWVKDTDVTYSTYYDLTVDQSKAINTTTGINLLYDKDANPTGLYNRVTYQVPVFPHTGNAILTCYNKYGDVMTYYVCPTKNYSMVQSTQSGTDNRNVLDTGADYCYEVSYDEAFNQKAGEIVSQEAGKLVIDSKTTGVTHLVGTVSLGDVVKIGGRDVLTLDETNKLYTSVQWCPIQGAVTPGYGSSEDEWALVGQTVTIKARVYDANNNRVNISGLNVAFNYGADAYEQLDAVGGRITTGAIGTTGITALRADNTTDINGEATLVLKGGKAATLKGLYAVESSNRYKVRLYYTNGHEAPITNWLCWVDPDLRFTPTVSDAAYAQTSVTAWEYSKAWDGSISIDATRGNKPSTSTDEQRGLWKQTTTLGTGLAELEPTVGSSWYYGFETYVTDVDRSWVTKKLTGLGIFINKDANTIGTVVAGTKNGEALATSTAAGRMDIIGRIDNTSSCSELYFSDQYGSKKGVGEGVPNIYKKLTLNVYWGADRLNAGFLTPNGSRIWTGYGGGNDYADVYFQAKDQYGNKWENQWVVFNYNYTNTTSGPTVVLTNPYGYVVDVDDYGKTWYKTDSNGVVRLRLVRYKSDIETVVTAQIFGERDVFAQTYTWVPVASRGIPLRLDVEKLADGTYQSTYDEKAQILRLTFTNEVVESSLTKEMISGWFRNPAGADTELSVASVAVVPGDEGRLNVVEIQLSNNLSNISGGNGRFEITIAHNMQDALGCVRYLTSLDGMSYKFDDVKFTIYADPKDKGGVSHAPKTELVNAGVIIPDPDYNTYVSTVATNAVVEEKKVDTTNNRISLPTKVDLGKAGVVDVTYTTSNTSVVAQSGAVTGFKAAVLNSGILSWGGKAGVAIVTAVYYNDANKNGVYDSSETLFDTEEFIVVATASGLLADNMYQVPSNLSATDVKAVGNAVNAVVTSGAAIKTSSTTVSVVTGSAVSVEWNRSGDTDAASWSKDAGVLTAKADKDGTVYLTATFKQNGVKVDVKYTVDIKEGLIDKISKADVSKPYK